MKITLLISSLSLGGAERTVCNIANYLSEKGHEVDVLTVSGEKSYHLNPKVNLICMFDETQSRLPHFLINLFRLYNFNKYLRKNKRDIYLSFLPKLSTLLLRQRKLIQGTVIIAERGDPKNIPQSLAKVRDKYYHLSDGFVFQTEEAQQYYKDKGFNISNSIIIPNAINSECLRPEYKGKPNYEIVTVGRLSHQKNIQMLIEAFSNLAHDYPKFTLKIYGDGPLKEELSSQAQTLGIQDRVKFMGFVDNITDRIKGASLFVLPSNYEGMPNALAEAMALGLPCISTDCPVGGPRFLIQDGINGLLIPVGDTNSLIGSMRLLLNNPDKASEIGRNARMIIDRLKPETIYNQWEKFLVNTVEKSNKT